MSAAPKPRARFIPELLQTHVEELAFVWGQRRAALHSPLQTQRDYADLSERLEAHIQGLLCAPAEALQDLLAAQLASEDADESFAAAYALLRKGSAAGAQAVVVEFSRAAGPTLQGLREALSLVAPTLTADEMRSTLQHAKPGTAAAAAAVLASHRQLPGASPRLQALLQDADAGIASLAWRAALLADRHGREAHQGTPARPYAWALAHDDAGVRDAAWAAVAWGALPRAGDTLRQRAAAGDPVALRWLAVLGHSDDVPLLQRAVLAVVSGPERCLLLARHGHPGGLNALVRWMQDADEPTAVAAGEAFELITGVEVQGDRRPLAVPADADDFEREMAPLAWFPDAAKARGVLDQRQAEWAAAPRWRRGVCIEPEPELQSVRVLDMQARWDLAARSAWRGGSAPPPPLA